MTTYEKYDELFTAYLNDSLPDSVTIWEIGFIENNSEKLDDIDPYFTDKQSIIIDEIYEKLNE